jgi:hypothetical protein
MRNRLLSPDLGRGLRRRRVTSLSEAIRPIPTDFFGIVKTQRLVQRKLEFKHSRNSIVHIHQKYGTGKWTNIRTSTYSIRRRRLPLRATPYPSQPEPARTGPASSHHRRPARPGRLPTSWPANLGHWMALLAIRPSVAGALPTVRSRRRILALGLNRPV